MLIKKRSDISSSEITPRSVYLNRRTFLTGAATLAGATLLGSRLRDVISPSVAAMAGTKLNYTNGPFGTTEKQTPLQDITHYNNYYEFSTDKYEPADLAKNFQTRPWTVRVEGLVNKPQTFDIEALLKMPLEERIYRMRCVEGWSMVIPWIGFPLKSLLDQVQPNSKAKFVEFTSLLDLKRFPGQQRNVLNWPYVEGLRLDEAVHPLTILAVGLYGDTLPNQDGAPIRLVVPWKYGFKGIKAIVKIRAGREAADLHLDPSGAQRIRLLFQREPERGPSPLEPGQGAPHRRVLQASHPDVQRLRRPGGVTVHRHGPEKELLIEP